MNSEPPTPASPAVDITASSDAYLALDGVAKRFGSHQVVESLDLSIARGELVSLLGPSGCGKTTLLRMIAGLTKADAGSIRLANKDLTRVAAHKRNISVVFQNYALFPHLTVGNNVAFGLRARKRKQTEIEQTVDRVLSLVQMSDFSDRAVTRLSGGQQQRIAVARALAISPDLLLLDEPFSALDRKLRETMQIELKSLLRSTGMTAIFVTHDQDEALAVSDRIAVMNTGRIEHFSEPSQLYARPATTFALDFVGLSTRIHAKGASMQDDRAQLSTPYGVITASANVSPPTSYLIGVRPENIVWQIPGQPVRPNWNQIEVPITDVIRLGSRTHLHGQAVEGDRILCEQSGTAPLPDLSGGRAVLLTWPVADTLIYPKD